jgi:superfamily II DNA/RNA helicase
MSYYVYQSSKKSRNNRGRQSAAPKKRGPKKDYIHPSKFVQAAKPVTVEKYEPNHKFTDFALEPFFHANISKMGITDPTPIQDKAIPAGLDGRDIVGIANTGTGKTAAFVIPVLQKLEIDQKAQAIILAPTRELARRKSPEFTRGFYSLTRIASDGRRDYIIETSPFRLFGSPGAR